MGSEELYQIAHRTHYSQKKYDEALVKYLQVIVEFPKSNEARYSREQVLNLLPFIREEDLKLSPSEKETYESILLPIRKEEIRQEEYRAEQEKIQQEEQKTQENRRKIYEKIEKIPVTTTMNIDGHKVKEYIDIASVEVVIGTGVISEFTSEIADLFGQRSTGFEQKLADAKKYAINRLKYEAVERGGDAIIGIDLDYTEFSGNRIGVVINGTIVKLDPPITYTHDN